MNTHEQRQASWGLRRYLGILIAVLLAPISYALGGQKPFVISISTLHDSFKSGAEIDIAVNLTNTSDKPVLLMGVCAPKGDFDGFTVEVKDIQNNIAPGRHLLRVERGEETARPDDIWTWSGPICGTVPPHKFSNGGFVVNRLYDMVKPGKYTIQVQRKDTYSKMIVKSNMITITVTP